MKILIVSKCPTHPPTAGNRKFIFEQVELFKRMGHDVFFLLIKEEALRKEKHLYDDVVKEMNRYWGKSLQIYAVGKLQKLYFNLLVRFRGYVNGGDLKCDDLYPVGLHKQINAWNKIERFDACLVNYYYLSKALTKVAIPLKGLVSHDYFAYKNFLVGKKRVYLQTNAHEEAIAMQRAPYIFALNDEEQIYFKKLSPQSKVLNVYSVYTYHPQPIVGNKNMLFLSGPNEYNKNGLRFFVDEILPTIIERFPDVKLLIGGGICKVIGEYNEHPNIKLLGFVDVPDEFYAKADIVINPTYQGTGLKIKTFEGISYDKVTMVHPHSQIGIFEPEAAPLFASTKADEWVEYLETIWEDHEAIARIKKRNKEYLNKMNEFIVEQYNEFLDSL